VAANDLIEINSNTLRRRKPDSPGFIGKIATY
jgi:hypothetical protein